MKMGVDGKNLTCVIYGLRRSGTTEIRYIGQTAYDLSNRLKRHFAEARAGNETPRSRWIRKAWSDGTVIEIITIERDAPWNEAEKRWIAQYRAAGADLLNLTDGGQGAQPGAKKSAETRARMSKVQRKHWADEAFRDKTVAGIRAERQSEQGRSRLSNQALRTWADEEIRARRTASISATYGDPQRSEKLRQHINRQRACPEMRERMRSASTAAARTPEARASAAEKTKLQWADPEIRAEMCRKLGEGARRRWQMKRERDLAAAKAES